MYYSKLYVVCVCIIFCNTTKFVSINMHFCRRLSLPVKLIIRVLYTSILFRSLWYIRTGDILSDTIKVHVICTKIFYVESNLSCSIMTMMIITNTKRSKGVKNGCSNSTDGIRNAFIAIDHYISIY